MLKRFALAGVCVAGLATSAFAVSVPKDVNGCLDTSLELFKSAENLSDDKKAKVEQLLGKLEGHCDAKQFEEAQSVADEVAGLVGN